MWRKLAVVKLAAVKLAALVLVLAACGPSSTPATQSPGQPLALDGEPAEPPEPVEVAAPEPEPPPEPVTVSFADNRITPSRPITYATGKAELTVDGDQVAAAIAAFLDEKSSMTQIRVEVHTDAQGSSEANQAMSEARALAAARALVAHGVACERLLATGFGETKPIDSNRTAEGRARNRRTEFVPVALRGVVIGGLPPDGGGVIAGDVCAR